MRIVIEKAKRLLTVYNDSGAVLLQCKAALGFSPVGHKLREGDGRTPEGEYMVCLRRETGKFGCALGISYPSLADARQAAEEGRLDQALLPLFEAAQQAKKRPPWGTALGGEIYIHGGGTDKDWTAGCIALQEEHMQRLFALCEEGTQVLIFP